MPSISDHPAQKLVKMLFIGDSGTGKTGALASLAEAGYNLHVLDFDNGLDILYQLTKDKPELAARIEFETCTDKMASVAGTPTVKGVPTAFSTGMKTLDKWTKKDFGAGDVIVIDSLTLMSRAAMNYSLSVAGRLNQRPQIQDWGYAMDLIESTLALLYSDSVVCNVIIISHILYNESEKGELLAGFPSALGNKLPPKVPRYFNAVLQAVTEGSGQNMKRKILTKGRGVVQCKTPLFNELPPSLPAETGLAEYFNKATGAHNG